MTGLGKHNPMVKRSFLPAIANRPFPMRILHGPLGTLKPNQLAILSSPSIARFDKNLSLIFSIPSTMQILHNILGANILQNYIDVELLVYGTWKYDILGKKQALLIKDAPTCRINQSSSEDIKANPEAKAWPNLPPICTFVTKTLGTKNYKYNNALSACTSKIALLGRPQNSSPEYLDLKSKNPRRSSSQLVGTASPASSNVSSGGHNVREAPRLTFKDQPGIGFNSHPSPHTPESKEITRPNDGSRTDMRMNTVDLDRLSNKIYSLLERRLTVERERRGI